MKEPYELVPESEEAFEGWDMLLKNRKAFASMVKKFSRIKIILLSSDIVGFMVPCHQFQGNERIFKEMHCQNVR